MLTETLNSKVNTIADGKLGLLINERGFLISKLDMVQNAILCVKFLEKYYSVVENRKVAIKIEAKKIDLS